LLLTRIIILHTRGHHGDLMTLTNASFKLNFHKYVLLKQMKFLMSRERCHAVL